MLKIIEKLVDFAIASGLAGALALLLAGAACLAAAGYAAYRAIGLSREWRRQQAARREVHVNPGPEDPTLPIPKEPAAASAIVVADSSGRFTGTERRAGFRRNDDHSAGVVLQIAANASRTAEDARQLADQAEQRVTDVEHELQREGGLVQRVGELEATCLRIENKVDGLPAEIVATFEARLVGHVAKTAQATVAALEQQLVDLVAAEVARQIARGRKAADQ